MQYTRIVLNEPHASIEGLYDNQLSFWNIDERFINEIVLKWTDWHTDFLFHGYKSEGIRSVRFPYSRFIVDAERLWNDPLEQLGQGIVYRSFDGYIRTVPERSERILLGLWHWHQQRLRYHLCEGALLLDCHSFPSEMSDVDVCIGFNEDWSQPDKETIEMAVNIFEENGYKVGINNPYSNSETPDCPFLYQSMMLEVNKKAYLETGTLWLKNSLHYRRNIREVMTILLSKLSV
ncbi:MAG: N-formylglutamate amidohydrolase [Bacteroidaceae bacterium]|nr:N-formylglutamate amidohydrolase [Bacteroidaceae bacterium]